MKKIAIGSDHGGFELKQKVIRHLEEKGYQCEDKGCYSRESCDYPVFGHAVAEAVAAGEADMGIVICTTGVAGPSASEHKPVGLLYAACGYNDKITVQKFELNSEYNRKNMKFMFSEKALQIVLNTLRN